MGSKHDVGKLMENQVDVILMPSHLVRKVRSIDWHVVTGHTYVYTTMYFARIRYMNCWKIL